MQAVRNIFLVLPALTIIHHVSDAIPLSEWLRELATNWREISHAAVLYVLGHIPWFYDLDIPTIILDELSLGLLMLASVVAAFVVQRLLGPRFTNASTQTPVPTQIYWVCVVVLGAIFFLTYDYQFYVERIAGQPEARTPERNLIAFFVSAIVWVMLTLLLLLGPTRAWAQRLLVGTFALLLFLAHAAAVSDAIRGSLILWCVFGFAMTLLIATTVILYRYNRNAIPLLLASAVGIIAADLLIQTGDALLRAA